MIPMFRLLSVNLIEKMFYGKIGLKCFYSTMDAHPTSVSDSSRSEVSKSLIGSMAYIMATKKPRFNTVGFLCMQALERQDICS